MVGELVLALVLYSLFLRPSAHPLALICPHLFCLRNIRYSKAALFCSLDRVLACLPCITFRYINCSSSFFIAVALSLPKRFSPFFAVIFSVKYTTMLSMVGCDKKWLVMLDRSGCTLVVHVGGIFSPCRLGYPAPYILLSFSLL